MPRGTARSGRVRWSTAIVFVTAIAAPLAAAAQAPTADPDWPCVQRYVPELSPAQVWQGPDPASVEGHWAADPEVAPLVPHLASSRISLEEAKQRIRAFAASLAPEERKRRLTLLFSGVFELLDAERRKAVARVRTFARGQRELAERIRTESEALVQARAEGGSGGDAVALDDKTKWDLRLFEERRATLTAVCEQPDLLEKRLFALAKAIGEALAPGEGG